MGKDVRSFDGTISEWPIFISHFEHTTEACKFSNSENMIRLQRSLTGEARTAVDGWLRLPENVPHVIKTLRTLYGRPDQLIRVLTANVEKIPPPQESNDSLVKYGLAVQNLVEHMKAANLHNHLSNPTLMQDLAMKLPSSLQREWGYHLLRTEEANLDDFGKFMSKVVDVASLLTFESPEVKDSAQKEKRKSKITGNVHAHSAESSSSSATGSSCSCTSSGKRAAKPCAACGRDGHRVADCSQFKGASVDERWKLVELKGLCRTCLNSHGNYPCRSWTSCGVEGCHLKHHTLLHDTSARKENVVVSASHVYSVHFQWPLFRVVPVTLYGEHTSVKIFAFIDEGSSCSLLEDSVAKQLDLHGPNEPLTLQWTGKVTRVEENSQRVQLNISKQSSSKQHKIKHARTVSNLVLPSQSLKYQELAQRFPHLRDLPMEDYESIHPQMLIGLDNLRLCVPRKLREGADDDPIGAKCHLGWSIYGWIPGESSRSAVTNFHVSAPVDPNREIKEQIRDCFTLEDAGTGVHCPNESLDFEDDLRAKRHVPTKLNAADQTTKMTKARFHGPKFLYQPEEEWPQHRTITPTEEELRPIHCHAAHFSSSALTTTFNSWTKVPQGAPEVRHAVVDKSSPIYTKWPFLDKRGASRSRGPINAVPYTSKETKFPVILPKKHLITSLLVDWFPCRFRHANRETVFNEIRQRFDIAQPRRVLDKVVSNCAFCRVAKAIPRPPAMSQLPDMRLETLIQPFTHTGVDYFGPVPIKVGRRNEKRWVAVVICLTTNAIHLEGVRTLSTNSCTMAVERYISRWGAPCEFWGDNVTCFQLKTTWRFIPPASTVKGSTRLRIWWLAIWSWSLAERVGTSGFGDGPGKDGKVQQALVRIAAGVLRRPAVKLAVLDVVEVAEPGHGVPDACQGSREGECNDMDTPTCGGAARRRVERESKQTAPAELSPGERLQTNTRGRVFLLAKKIVIFL